jgi:hypothetical protein
MFAHNADRGRAAIARHYDSSCPSRHAKPSGGAWSFAACRRCGRSQGRNGHGSNIPPCRRLTHFRIFRSRERCRAQNAFFSASWPSRGVIYFALAVEFAEIAVWAKRADTMTRVERISLTAADIDRIGRCLGSNSDFSRRGDPQRSRELRLFMKCRLAGTSICSPAS